MTSAAPSLFPSPIAYFDVHTCPRCEENKTREIGKLQVLNKPSPNVNQIEKTWTEQGLKITALGQEHIFTPVEGNYRFTVFTDGTIVARIFKQQNEEKSPKCFFSP